MVRVSLVLARIPVIKFRKGGVGGTQVSPSKISSDGAVPPAQPQPHRNQPVASMSTGAITDIDLPPRYRRQPLSQEEIDYINGGGIV